MKKGATIGIAIAIIAAGGLGIYAVSSTQGGILGEDTTVEFSDEATATVEEDFGGKEAESIDFEDKAAATVEEDSDEGEEDSFRFEERVTITVENP